MLRNAICFNTLRTCSDLELGSMFFLLHYSFRHCPFHQCQRSASHVMARRVCPCIRELQKPTNPPTMHVQQYSSAYRRRRGMYAVNWLRSPLTKYRSLLLQLSPMVKLNTLYLYLSSLSYIEVPTVSEIRVDEICVRHAFLFDPFVLYLK